MDEVKFPLFHRTRAISRMCNISSYTTELLEINSKEPLMQILFIPGNPGIVSFYRDFLEALYENLEGHASITGKKYALKIFEIIIFNWAHFTRGKG
ncbi:hypothetical protein ACMD2_05320 [Ananas comosus]|uniref:Uncharacterized protein n=1 Tax=Ananas comosus TaxID=4615 RepID=A0A199ULN1_ANACO|nr:hypothetical protein ACMD2_05320 [Ananas comosus]